MSGPAEDRGVGQAQPLAARRATVAELRASLAGRPDVLADVPPEQLAQACREFADLPEVSGSPSRRSTGRGSATPGSGR